MTATIEPVIADWLRQECPANELAAPSLAGTGQADLVEAGILDSLSILRLVAFLEEHFGLTMPLEEFVPENFASSAGIARMVARNLPQGARS